MGDGLDCLATEAARHLMSGPPRRTRQAETASEPPTARQYLGIHRVDAYCPRCDHFRLLDGMLQTRQFLLGDRLSLADIPIGTALYRYFELDIERPELPNVSAWYRRLQQRPAYREHVMIPFAELRGRLDY